MQGVLWDELLSLLAAAAAEPALLSCLAGQELAEPFTTLALPNLSVDQHFIQEMLIIPLAPILLAFTTHTQPKDICKLQTSPWPPHCQGQLGTARWG